MKTIHCRKGRDKTWCGKVVSELIWHSLHRIYTTCQHCLRCLDALENQKLKPLNMSYYDDYIFYSSENEASPKYHKWCALVSLACAITRRVWVQQGDWPVYPNLYVGLVGDPASGKSVAMGFAERLVGDFTDTPICPASITREALTQHLEKECLKSFIYNGQKIDYTSLSIFANELVTILGAEPIRMIDLMTELYDARDFKVVTKGQGNNAIVKPCINLLGCITPSTLEGLFVQKLVSGGFTRRIIPVFSRNRGKPIPRPRYTEDHKQAKSRCVAYAKQVQNISGPFSWTPEAEAWFDHWYIHEKTPQMNHETNEVMRRYRTAKDVLLLKVAMLLALAEKPELVLTKKCLMQANDWLTEIEPDILTVFGGGGGNKLAPIQFAMERFIQDAGADGLSPTIIKRVFTKDASDADIMLALRHLQDVDSIVIQGRQETNSQGLQVRQDYYVHRSHVPTV